MIEAGLAMSTLDRGCMPNLSCGSDRVGYPAYAQDIYQPCPLSSLVASSASVPSSGGSLATLLSILEFQRHGFKGTKEAVPKVTLCRYEALGLG